LFDAERLPEVASDRHLTEESRYSLLDGTAVLSFRQNNPGAPISSHSYCGAPPAHLAQDMNADCLVPWKPGSDLTCNVWIVECELMYAFSRIGDDIPSVTSVLGGVPTQTYSPGIALVVRRRLAAKGIIPLAGRRPKC
jgi:hypothetical protein